MQLTITLDENAATGRTSWHVQGDQPVFDGSATADSLDQALTDATAWVRQVEASI
ncbi:hypothetical protein [Gordonia hydrophobica]|uniref:Uncharacterized protein n=1 Tax=Gordonia hydrophobica TaxID=40516 RepID=A0ABZ2TXS7_9ACTN|nr:hypothetical protein [Gordonia hydrophobica]MBM7366359.1 hypothetical protein [Gordonia hydrophobica]